MKTGTASRTAQFMALYRAMETHRPRGKRLFSDPYAIRFIENKKYRLACRLASFAPAERMLYRIIQDRIPGALASGLARTRYIDELLEKTIRQGNRQVILLGAGFDTRSLRLDYLRRLPVIEIDHPDTSRRKIQILQSLSVTPAGIVIDQASGPGRSAESGQASKPGHSSWSGQLRRYLQIDFNQQDLGEFLREQQVDYNIPTTLIWEGVTNYLQREAIARTFAITSRFAPGSAIIFTYIHRQVLDNPSSYFGAAQLIQDLKEIEEPWTCGFYPEELPSWLSSLGWQLMEDQGAAVYRQRYLPERTTILKGYEFYRVAMAINR